ncbi:MAG: arsenate reductase ArsC [Alphaproteobacteria bacterium]|nr:arsenate reductase ArsC [Alphaproteobacteria bacterium]
MFSTLFRRKRRIDAQLASDETALARGRGEKSAPSRVYNVLFLCTGNSARSVLAECILGRLGGGRFRAFSAGSHPKGEVNRFTLELLATLGYDVSGLRSKSWDEFAAPGAPHMDFVFTVCDDAAGEVCPIWPGQPMSAHWGFEDPAAFTGSEPEIRQKFAEVYGQIYRRLEAFVSLPIEALDELALKCKLDEMGEE